MQKPLDPSLGISFFLSLLPELVGCWPWDVCAGIVIAKTSGLCGNRPPLIFGASSSSENFGIVTEGVLTRRKYLVACYRRFKGEFDV